MRVFVTGWKGLLGSALVPVLERNHEVDGMDIEDKGANIGEAEDKGANICDRDYIRLRLDEFRPDWVIHLAAMTAVDECETSKDEAFRVNRDGSRVVAEETQRLGAQILTLSTDYVFDGDKERPYDEGDVAVPLSVHGRSKLAGEKEIQKASTQWVVVRSAWLFGPGGRNFVDTILGLLETRDTVSVVNDQVGSPTYSRDLARALAQLIEKPASGTYHMVNREPASWYELASTAVGMAGLDPARVQPTTTQHLSRPVPRPRYSVLDPGRVSREHGISFRSWQKALMDYIQERNQAPKQG